jgi:hypothetical protein
MIAQDHACSTTSKVSVCKLHTLLNTFDLVIDSTHKMLIKSVLQNLHKVICFVFLLVCDICCDVHDVKIKKVYLLPIKPHPSAIAQKVQW